jgi:hypothetical protein
MADGERMLVGGYMRELVETLYTRGYLKPGIDPDSWRKKYHCWTPFSAEGLKLVLDELAGKARVEIRFFTRVIDADTEGNKVKGIILSSVEGYEYIKAKTFVDATGDAVLSQLCGAPYREAGIDTKQIMPSTLACLFSGVDWSKPAPSFQNPEGVKKIEEEFAAGNFIQCDRHLVGISQVGKEIGYLNGGHIFGLRSTKVKDLTAGMILGRKIARDNEKFLKKYSPACADMELTTTASLMGVRESRQGASSRIKLRFFAKQLISMFMTVLPKNTRAIMMSSKKGTSTVPANVTVSLTAYWFQRTGRTSGLPDAALHRI